MKANRNIPFSKQRHKRDILRCVSSCSLLAQPQVERSKPLVYFSSSLPGLSYLDSEPLVDSKHALVFE
jgi:hypothetical protein